MKKFAGLLAVFALLLHSGGVLAQSSDYEIIRSYKARHQALLESIKAAQDLGQCDNLESEISRLEGDYSGERELLGEALHPESFAGSISALRDNLGRSTERITLTEKSRVAEAKVETFSEEARKAGQTIEEYMKEKQNYADSLEKLTQEVQELSGRIQALSEENSGLLGQVRTLQQESRKDKAAIAKLKALTEKLAANIRDRDELILRMMDGLLADYSKAALTDLQKQNLLVTAQGNDYVGRIIATIDENVKYTETAILAPQDARLVREEQRRLSSKWNDIKPAVGKLYPDEDIRTTNLAAVDDRLSLWKQNVDDAMWKSIAQVFVDQNISIGPFRNADEFETRLLAFVDEQINNPSRGRYQAFMNMVWDSPIKDQWLPVIPTEELTAKQRADIEDRITVWYKKVSALVWRWVLIGVFGLAVIAVIVVMILKKRTPLPPAPAEEDATGPVQYPPT